MSLMSLIQQIIVIDPNQGDSTLCCVSVPLLPYYTLPIRYISSRTRIFLLFCHHTDRPSDYITNFSHPIYFLLNMRAPVR